MLQKIKMVKKARKAVESLYEGTCNVIEHQKVKQKNGATTFEDITVLKNQPCRLSFKAINSINQNENNLSSEITQVTILFINPDIKIKPGSKIVVTQNDVTKEYKQSGEPAIYATHQEIILELFKRWS